MMKKFLLSVFFVSLLVTSSTVFSAAASTGGKTVFRILQQSGGLYFMLSPTSGHINPGGCKSKNYYRVPAQMEDKMFRMLLTAKASGKKINVSLEGCLGSYPKVRWMILED